MRFRRHISVGIEDPSERAALLFGAGALAGAAFGLLAAASARRATVRPDNRAHEAMKRRLKGPAGRAAQRAAPAIDPAGKWYVYAPVALGAAAAVFVAPGRVPRRRRARWSGAAAIAVVPALVTALSPVLDRRLPQPRVGRRKRPVDHPVFPSGHALRLTAVSGATAYVAARERLVDPGVAWPVAVGASLASGVGRLLREKHLASDVVGGWLGGAAIAAFVAGAYELASEPGRPRRRLRLR